MKWRFKIPGLNSRGFHADLFDSFIEGMMSKHRIDLSIIIVSWNTRDYTKQCIDSILKNTRDLSFEIIVVDNHSRDGTQEMIRQSFPDILLIENDENLGLARANNQGVRRSGGRFIIFLNADTYVAGDALLKMVRFLEAHKDAGAVNPRTWLDSALTMQYGVCPMFTPGFSAAVSTPLGRYRTSIKRIWRENLNLGFNQQDQEVEALIGACLMVPRALLDRFGMLDEKLFIYFEDIELSHRLRKNGLKLYIVSDAHIVHYLSKSGCQNPEMNEIYFKSMRYFYEHYFGKFSLAYLYPALKIYRRTYRFLRRRLEKGMAPHQKIPLDNPTITWPPDPQADSYLFEVGRDINFIGVAGVLRDRPFHSLERIDPSGIQDLVYYWRVRSVRNGKVSRKYIYGSFSYLPHQLSQSVSDSMTCQ